MGWSSKYSHKAIDVQEETLLRLQRLLRHGDLRGAQRALARAKLLNVDIKYEELEVPWC